MKRLLSILGTISLVASTAGLAVSCSSNVKRFNIPTLEEELYNKVLTQITGDPELSDLLLGDVFDDIDFDTIVTNIMNRQISKFYYSQSQNEIANGIGLNSKEQSYYDIEVEEMANTIATNNFYTEYTSSMISGTSTAKDVEILNQTLILNPFNLMSKNDYDGTYTVWFDNNGDENYTLWALKGENNSNINNIPTLENLDESNFVIAYNAGSSISLDDTKIFTSETDGDDVTETLFYSQDGTTVKKFSGKDALKYRFQYYFNSEVKPEIYTNTFTMTFLEQEMVRSNNILSINRNSNVATKVQTWNNTNHTSNLKMVWSFTMDESKTKNAWDAIKDSLNTIDGTIKSSNATSIATLINELNTSTGGNISKAGKDPYFGFNGFNGFVQNDGSSVSSVDGNLIANADAYESIANTNGPAIISKDGFGTGFDSDQKNKKDFYIVLPLYLIDLLNDKTNSFTNGTTTNINYAVSGGLQQGNLSISKYNDLQTYDLSTVDDWKIEVDGRIYTLEEAVKRFPDWTIINQNNTTGFVNSSGNLTINSGAPSGFTNLYGSANNTHDNTIGNIALDEWVEINTELNGNLDGVEVDGTKIKVDGSMYQYGEVVTFGTNKLSFDDGNEEGLITFDGTEKTTNRTKSYRINLGTGTNNPNGLIGNFYEEGIESLDVQQLSTTNKTNLLKQIEYITSKDSNVEERAKVAIYPMFLESDDVLYQALYDSIASYLRDDVLNNGVTD